MIDLITRSIHHHDSHFARVIRVQAGVQQALVYFRRGGGRQAAGVIITLLPNLLPSSIIYIVPIFPLCISTIVITCIIQFIDLKI